MRRQVLDIPYTLRPGTGRSTTDIVIERDGSVVVRPPASLSVETVDEIVSRKRLWIYRGLAEWRELNSSAVAREWTSGESFPYLGRAYKLSLVDGKNTQVSLKSGRFQLSRDLLEKEGALGAKQAFRKFYKRKARLRINRRISHYETKVGVKVNSVQIKNLGFKWGRCDPAGNVAFHWKCIMAPATILDYIVVHELCHLLHSDHSDAFWNEVDKVLPDYLERKSWLKLFGASLTL